MPRTPRRSPSPPRRPPASFGKRRTVAITIRPPAARKTGWEKAAVLVQAIGAFAIVVSIAALFIGVRQFNEQQTATAARMLDQQRQATLSEYLTDMSELVLQYNLPSSRPESSVRAIAVARTLTAVRDLDGARKATLMRYLWEAGLLARSQPIVDLFHANLNGALFPIGVNLYRITLSPVSLSKASLIGAQLQGADLSGSSLVGSDLSRANLTCFYRSTNSHIDVCAKLSGADLMSADLSGADLSGADLIGADLSRRQPERRQPERRRPERRRPERRQPAEG